MSKPIYLTAKEAAAELGVQPATLYAYVSRGMIKSVAGHGKQNRYDANDIRRLKGRKSSEISSGSKPLSGDPVLETELTMISDAGPVYRGRLAKDLAVASTLESVATLLWASTDNPFDEAAPEALPVLPATTGPLHRLMMALSAWPMQDRAAYTQSPKLLQVKGAALLRYAVAALLNTEPKALPIHTQFGQAYGVSSTARNIIRATLILAADHELNTSAFAARCAASTRAPLHSALLSGLGAFTGPRHGASSDRVSAWLNDITPDTNIEEYLSGRLSRGDSLPGFGHRIYQDCDPRADFLLGLLFETEKTEPFVDCIPKITAGARDLFGQSPNIDFVLAAIQKIYDLPPDAGKIIFCAGRIVGWIAHALEQYAAPEQIRPRATYVGLRPD